MSSKRVFLLVSLLVLASMLAAQCVAPAPAPEQVVETVVVEKEVKVVETVEVEKEVVVTPTPEPVRPPGEPVYGGELTISFASSPQPSDPPTALGWPGWNLIFDFFFNALYAWDVEGNIVPELAAELPTISADGTVYTIPLRQGVKFCNGREMTAEDVKWSIERATWPETGGWGAGFISVVEGVDEVAAGEAEEISGITVIDDYTIEFKLKQPEAVFPHNLGITPHAIVPKEEVEKWGEEFGYHACGTGPFMVEEWIADVQIVAVKNPEYFKEGKPYVDRVVMQLGKPPEVAFLEFQRGDVDILGDGIPEGELRSVVTNPIWEPYYHESSGLTMLYLWLNNTWAPLDNPDVRRAVAMAIDREKILELHAGRGSVATGFLAPLYTGYVDRENPYPYDPDEAQALLAEAGYPDGFEMSIGFRGGTVAVLHGRVAQSIAQDLEQIGIEVEIVPVDPGVWPQWLKDPTHVASYVGEWWPDYPEAYDLWNFSFSCHGAESGTNRNFYCSEELDSKIRKAEADAAGANDPIRTQMYQELDETLIEDTASVPLLFAVLDTLAQPSVGNFYLHPQWFWVFEDYWKAE